MTQSWKEGTDGRPYGSIILTSSNVKVCVCCCVICPECDLRSHGSELKSMTRVHLPVPTAWRIVGASLPTSMLISTHLGGSFSSPEFLRLTLPAYKPAYQPAYQPPFPFLCSGAVAIMGSRGRTENYVSFHSWHMTPITCYYHFLCHYPLVHRLPYGMFQLFLLFYLF